MVDKEAGGAVRWVTVDSCGVEWVGGSCGREGSRWVAAVVEKGAGRG